MKKVLTEPRNKDVINNAVDHERRLRFHSQISLSRSQAGQAATDFLRWVESLIPSDKYRLFVSFFRYPVETVNVTEQIFDDLEKIFDGKDPVYIYNFLSDDDKQDWHEYRTQVLNDQKVWRTKGFDAMKSGINSVMIVDLPEEQDTGKPAPYFYFLDISQVVDFEMDGNKIDWIIFKQPDDRLAVFDNETYKVYQVKDGQINPETLVLISESRHELGFCPARFFWDTPISYAQPALKKSPVTRHLATLDHLLRKVIDRKHLENYASYPVYVTYEQDCDYRAEVDGIISECDNGYLTDESGNYLLTRSGAVDPCPVCSSKKLSGAGSYVEVTPPSDENGGFNLIDAVRIIGVDRSSLDYNTEEVQRLEEKIHSDVTGYDGEMMKNQAVNEKQVIAGFEGRSNILRNVKKNFESAQKWVSETICKLRYGDSFRSASISYGEEFYLYSADFILGLYEKAKTSNLPPRVLDMLENQYYETKFKNNPEELERKKIEINLDPFRHLDTNQVQTMYDKGLIADYKEYMLKVNFSTYLMRFERENMNINAFGEALNFDKKINSISEALKLYVPDLKPVQEETIKTI